MIGCQLLPGVFAPQTRTYVAVHHYAVVTAIPSKFTVSEVTTTPLKYTAFAGRDAFAEGRKDYVGISNT